MTTTSTIPPAPAGLTESSNKLWTAAMWPGCPLPRQAAVESALRALDQASQARAIVDRDGLTTVNRDTGVHHAHPAVRIEKDCRAAFARTWSALGLDNMSTPKPFGVK